MKAVRRDSLGRVVDAQPLIEVALDRPVPGPDLVERGLEVARTDVQDGLEELRVAASCGEGGEERLDQRPEVPPALQEVVHHRLLRHVEQELERRRGPPRAVLPRGAVHERRPVWLDGEIAVQRPEPDARARQPHEGAVLLHPQGLGAPVAQHVAGSRGVLEQGEKPAWAAVRPRAEHVQRQVPGPGGEPVGRLCLLAGHAQVVHRPDGEPRDGVDIRRGSACRPDDR